MSDWSSDVCASDVVRDVDGGLLAGQGGHVLDASDPARALADHYEAVDPAAHHYQLGPGQRAVVDSGDRAGHRGHASGGELPGDGLARLARVAGEALVDDDRVHRAQF